MKGLLATIGVIGALYGVGLLDGYTFFRSTPSTKGAETIYIRNLSPRFISDREIKNDIPAWEAGANKDFAPVWRSEQVKLVFIGRKQAPSGAIVATFVNNGPVKGALAYHTVTAGVPAIIVYAGVADFYGYSNSVSFTHELYEMLADPVICVTNQGYPYATVTLEGGSTFQQPAGTMWATEVADAVEADSYTRKGANGQDVSISDFVTPNWFNDEVNGPYDFMHLVQAPFTVLKGGYSQYWDGYQWQVVQDFRHAGSDADGFLKAEKGERP